MAIKQDILLQVEKDFQVTEAQLKCVMDKIQDEMKTGLESKGNHQQTELKMIPSYVTGYPTGEEKGTYLALEISGMDVYVCQVKLKGEGGKLAINQYQYRIPDDLTAGEDVTVLIDYVADCVNDFQQRVGADRHQVYAMAISVGFAVSQTGLDQGIIVALEHGFDFPQVIGCNAVDLLDGRFKAKGLKVKIVAMANDGVCTLLAHAYQHPSTRIGVIHSAGTNCAYYDTVANVKQLHSFQQEQEMIINTEWCGFGSRYLPSTQFDDLLDLQSNNPGIHRFEKMTTGMYLGEIVRQVLIYLINHHVLAFDTRLLNIPYQFDTSYMYVCETDENELDDIRILLEEIFHVGKTTLTDRRLVQRVCEWVGYRAALLVGTCIAGVIQYTLHRGVGLDLENGLAIG
ncbi:hexokinase-domain-containing protein [Sporodiniella umbellata]|nr:hexokinase-domain-containing protein [Sporodiniella umbellata]